MARLVFHEHPEQGGECLTGAFRSYVQRIPVSGFVTLDAATTAIRRLPFEADPGSGACEDGICDTRCRPAQRSRIWPPSMNCWESAAHFAAAAQALLPDDWTVHIWDRTLSNGARHVWPSLASPDGQHVLIDLNTLALGAYPVGEYSGAATRPAANGDGVGNQILGGLHVIGRTALSLFGLGGVAKKLEEVEREALPDWALEDPPAEPPRRAPGPKDGAPPPRRETRDRPARGGPMDELI